MNFDGVPTWWCSSRIFIVRRFIPKRYSGRISCFTRWAKDDEKYETPCVQGRGLRPHQRHNANILAKRYVNIKAHIFFLPYILFTNRIISCWVYPYKFCISFGILFPERKLHKFVFIHYLTSHHIIIACPRSWGREGKKIKKKLNELELHPLRPLMSCTTVKRTDTTLMIWAS